MKRLQNIFLLVGTLIFNLALDRITKLLAAAFLKDGPALSLFGNFVVLRYAENTGAFLSLGSNWPEPVKYLVLLLIPILFCMAGFLYCCLRETDSFRGIVLTTIIAGGLGNLFDRLVNDFSVIDFMNFGIGRIRTGILNAADLSVTFGAVVLIVHEYGISKRK